jgi:hypothetical protein
MFLAQAESVHTSTVVLQTLDGVTTALVVFLLLCLVLPHLVKHRQQYYGALGCVGGIIFVHTLGMMIGSAGFQVFGGVVIGVLQLATLILCVLFAGGLTPKELAGDLKGAYEVLRRGETEKEVIIPLRSQQEQGGKPPVYVADSPGPTTTPKPDPDDKIPFP